MIICIATTDKELSDITSVLLQLRPQYTSDSLITQIKKQQTDGYQLAYCILESKIACVAGFVITENLDCGQYLYVDDLVSNEAQRSRGAGKAMITWLKQHAREQGCRELHLDSGMRRKDAHRFYDREGFNCSSLHFSINDLG